MLIQIITIGIIIEKDSNNLSSLFNIFILNKNIKYQDLDVIPKFNRSIKKEIIFYDLMKV